MLLMMMMLMLLMKALHIGVQRALLLPTKGVRKGRVEKRRRVQHARRGR